MKITICTFITVYNCIYIAALSQQVVLQLVNLPIDVCMKRMWVCVCTCVCIFIYVYIHNCIYMYIHRNAFRKRRCTALESPHRCVYHRCVYLIVYGMYTCRYTCMYTCRYTCTRVGIRVSPHSIWNVHV